MTPPTSAQHRPPVTSTRLWIIRDARYVKVCADPVGGRNVAIIDLDGFISAKRGPVSIIRREPSFEPSATGYSRSHGGSQYLGWASFGSVEGAIEWLRQHFDVRGA